MALPFAVEQRPDVRLPFSGPASIRSMDLHLVGTIRDISCSGCFIEVAPRFEVGTRMQITFSLDPDDSCHLATHGQIVRRGPKGIGVRFSHLDPETSGLLRQWIESRNRREAD